MLNFRERTLFRSLMSNPIRFIELFIVTLILRGGVHSTANFNPLHKALWAHREKRYEISPEWVPPESTCKDKYKEMF
jgi:hypothetical protein